LKKPLCGNRQQKETVSKFPANTGSRKHAVSFSSPFSSPAVAAEGRLKATSPIPPLMSKRAATGSYIQVFDNSRLF
jgi:hypothetical protein